MFSNLPLTDITNVQFDANVKKTVAVPAVPKAVRRNDPYAYQCIVDIPDDNQLYATFENYTFTMGNGTETQTQTASVSPQLCNALIQFKCHQAEYSSPIILDRGQYVVVQGDRGIDIGVVIRINNKFAQTFAERTGPTGSILRHATQREVDYWAGELKEAEAVAVAYCQSLIHRHSLDMQVVHAEYQFDKKKLTFYYESRARIDFVQLLKELYREFGCRIWMEKVRSAEL